MSLNGLDQGIARRDQLAVHSYDQVGVLTVLLLDRLDERSPPNLLPDDSPAAETCLGGGPALVGADHLQTLVGFHDRDNSDVRPRNLTFGD